MKRFKKGFILGLFLVFGLVFASCNLEDINKYDLRKVSNAYITIDINPSIEIITNDEGFVDQVNALNEDAIKLLVDTDFAGKTVEDVINAILELAIEYGYIDFDLENAVLISAATNIEEETKELENKISKKVQDFISVRKIKVEVLKASLEAAGDIKALAEEYGISIGKVKMVTHVLMIDSDLTYEVAAKMSIRDLNKIIQKDRDEVREFYSENIREEFQNAKELLKRDLNIEIKGLLNQAIQEASAEEFLDILKDSTVDFMDVKALYHEYYNSLLAVNLENDEDEEVDELEDKSIDRAKIEELKNQYEELENVIQTLKNQVKGNNLKDLSKEERDAILDKIKELLLKQKEILLQMNEFGVSQDGFFDWQKGIRGPKMPKLPKSSSSKQEDPYKGVKKEYEELFSNLGIDLEELEYFFMTKIVNEIKELRSSMEEELRELREVFINDSKVIKDQIREENKLLKEIWKRK